MNAALRLALPVVGLLALSGCMSTYRMAPGTPAASVLIEKGATAWICADAPPQLLIRKEDGKADIPAGKRITLGVNFYSSDGYMAYSCSPSMSLVPEVGGVYLQDFETEGEACTAFVYRKTDDKRIGLAFDETIDRGGPGCVYDKKK